MVLGTADDSLYQNFYAECQARNIGAFEKVNEYIIDSVLQSIDSAEITNQNIESQNTMEDNEKLVNAVYVKKLRYESDEANGVGAQYVFDSTEVSELESVAYQHPALGGNSVYMARILLWIDVQDDITLQTRSVHHRIPPPNEEKVFKLYPNPNNGSMTLEYSIGNSDVGVFSIYDISGRLVKQVTLNYSENKTVIDATELNAGAYYYTIKVNDGKVKAGKLIIVR